MGSRIPVLYEDNHILVVEKPVNLLSQADAGGDADLLTLLKQDVKIRYNKPGNVYLGLVHRLDRPVGGVMVFARTSKAAARLSQQVREHTLRKTYLAVVHGAPADARGTLRHFLRKDTGTNTVTAYCEPVAETREALLDYQLVAGEDELSLVRINLRTGRSHQIRVQFAATGHPLWGDQKYGVKLSRPGEQLALWSHGLTLLHPTKGEKMSFSSSPPLRQPPWEYFAKHL